MTIQRMDHVGIVVEDLKAAINFFIELGLELQGEGSVEGRWVDRVVALDGVRAEFAFLQTPDGHGRLELAKFHSPSTRNGNRHAPANTPGIRHVAFAVDDIEAVVGACEATAPSSSVSWSATRTAIGSALSAAPRGSSSSWPSRSADGAGPPRPHDPTSLPAVGYLIGPVADRPDSASWFPIEHSHGGFHVSPSERMIGRNEVASHRDGEAARRRFGR